MTIHAALRARLARPPDFRERARPARLVRRPVGRRIFGAAGLRGEVAQVPLLPRSAGCGDCPSFAPTGFSPILPFSDIRAVGAFGRYLLIAKIRILT